MNLIELNRALKQLRLGGMAAVLETRLLQAQAQSMAPIDLISCLISDELSRRSNRLLERRQNKLSFEIHRRPWRVSTSPSTKSSIALWSSIWLRLASSLNMKTLCSWVHPAPARATWLRPSVWPPSNRATGCSTVRPIPCLMRSPKRPSMARVNSTWSCSPPCRCSSSMISACVSSRLPRPRIFWRSSCVAMSGPAP